MLVLTTSAYQNATKSLKLLGLMLLLLIVFVQNMLSSFTQDISLSSWQYIIQLQLIRVDPDHSGLRLDDLLPKNFFWVEGNYFDLRHFRLRRNIEKIWHQNFWISRQIFWGIWVDWNWAKSVKLKSFFKLGIFLFQWVVLLQKNVTGVWSSIQIKIQDDPIYHF